MGGQLVLDRQEFLVPIGLHFVNVQPGLEVEGQLNGAGRAFVRAQIAQAIAEIDRRMAVAQGGLKA